MKKTQKKVNVVIIVQTNEERFCSLREVPEGMVCRLNGFTLRRKSCGSFVIENIVNKKSRYNINDIYPLTAQNEDFVVTLL